MAPPVSHTVNTLWIQWSVIVCYLLLLLLKVSFVWSTETLESLLKPVSSKNFSTISTCPELLAQSTGLAPAALVTSTAPEARDSNWRMMCRCPLAHAQWRGVFPSESFANASISISRSHDGFCARQRLIADSNLLYLEIYKNDALRGKWSINYI